jgi:GrpB-like predicted nucleotidyltransferase (UPF0157 family)
MGNTLVVAKKQGPTTRKPPKSPQNPQNQTTTQPTPNPTTRKLGLAAKPIVDVVLSVADSSNEEPYVPALEAEGYVLTIREDDWFEHRMFKGPDTNVNLHVFSDGAVEVDRMVAFRDHLRVNTDDRRLYESVKRQLATQHWEFVQNYADAKSPVVEDIMRRALG